MKKLFLLISFVVMLSCETDPVGVKLTTESLRQELILKSPNELKNAFNALSPELQRNLWHDRLILESEFHYGDKKEYLVLIAKLQRVAPNFNYQNAKSKVVDLFGIVEARRILTTLYLPNEKQFDLSSAKVDPVVCNCSAMSDWCDFQYNNGEPGEDWHCTGACTVQSVAGCGTMFVYACQGLCVNNRWN